MKQKSCKLYINIVFLIILTITIFGGNKVYGAVVPNVPSGGGGSSSIKYKALVNFNVNSITPTKCDTSSGTGYIGMYNVYNPNETNSVYACLYNSNSSTRPQVTCPSNSTGNQTSLSVYDVLDQSKYYNAYVCTRDTAKDTTHKYTSDALTSEYTSVSSCGSGLAEGNLGKYTVYSKDNSVSISGCVFELSHGNSGVACLSGAEPVELSGYDANNSTHSVLIYVCKKTSGSNNNTTQTGDTTTQSGNGTTTPSTGGSATQKEEDKIKELTCIYDGYSIGYPHPLMIYQDKNGKISTSMYGEEFTDKKTIKEDSPGWNSINIVLELEATGCEKDGVLRCCARYLEYNDWWGTAKPVDKKKWNKNDYKLLSGPTSFSSVDDYMDVEGETGPRNDYSNVCNNEGVKNAVLFIGKLVRVAIWAVPLIIIVLGMVDFTKAITSSDEKALGKATEVLIKRIVAGLSVFLIPTIIIAILQNIGIKGIDQNSCVNCLLYPFNDCKPDDKNKDETPTEDDNTDDSSDTELEAPPTPE